MDKWIINNYIVQMRHSVSQARVHVLNKLVREIRKLQNKKGTDEQKEKNSRKAERLRQEVIFIKKLDPDELSKYALLCTEDPCKMLNMISLSIEERSKVRLIAHKSITQQVEIFRAKYPEWALKLPPLLVQLGLQIKYKKKARNQESNSVITISDVTRSNRNPKENSETENMIVMEDISTDPAISKVTRDDEKLKRRSQTENKSIVKQSVFPRAKRSKEKAKEKGEEERKRSESARENTENDCEDENIESEYEGESDYEDDNIESEYEGGSDNEGESIESKYKDEKIESEIEDEVIKSEIEDISDHNSSSNVNILKKFQSPHKETRVLSDKYVGKKKINGIAEVRRFADLLESERNSQNESPTEEDEDPNPTNAVTDPFFLTGDNSGESADEQSSSEEEEVKRKNSFRNGDRFFPNSRDYVSERRHIGEKSRYWNFEKKNSAGQRYSRGDQKVPTMNRKQRRMLEKARPEMKKGSAFSQSGSSVPKSFEDPGRVKSLLNLGQTNVGCNTEKQEILHPSWEAKRKQREQILPFQGKKIKFDDGD